MPLHRHQESSTLRKYITPVIALLCLFVQLKHQDLYKIPIPEVLQEAVSKLEIYLWWQKRMLKI